MNAAYPLEGENLIFFPVKLEKHVKTTAIFDKRGCANAMAAEFQEFLNSFSSFIFK